MNYYRLFRKYQGGVGWTEVDPLTLTVKSKTTADVVVETLTTTKDTTYYANGHYYVGLDITEYSLDTDYKLIWTYEMVSGTTQTVVEYFKLSIVGEETVLVARPIGDKISQALQRFGDTLLIVSDDGYTAILGKTWLNARITDYWLLQYVRNVMFVNNPEVFGGNIIRDVIRSKYYLIYNIEKVTLEDDIMEQKGTLLYINKECEIQRLTGTAGEMGGTNQTFTSQKKEIKVHIRAISSALREERPSLLETASFLIYLQNTETPLVLDRIVVDSKNYQVAHINKVEFEGIWELQLSLDRR